MQVGGCWLGLYYSDRFIEYQDRIGKKLGKEPTKYIVAASVAWQMLESSIDWLPQLT